MVIPQDTSKSTENDAIDQIPSVNQLKPQRVRKKNKHKIVQCDSQKEGNTETDKEYTSSRELEKKLAVVEP